MPQESRTNKDNYWGRFAGSYDKGADFVVGKALRQAVRAKLLQEGNLGRLVEFGCGTGFFTEAIANQAANVLATDISPEMLEIAARRLEGFHNVTLDKADCRGTGFRSGEFDTVLVVNVVQTIDRPSLLLKESHRLLRGGGLLLVVTYTDYGLNLFEKMIVGMRYFVVFGFPPVGGMRNFSPAGLKRLVESEGFEVLHLQVIGGNPKAIYMKARPI